VIIDPLDTHFVTLYSTINKAVFFIFFSIFFFPEKVMEMAYNPKVVSIVLFAIWALSITIIFLPRKFQNFQLFY